MNVYSFEKLDVWERASSLSKEIYIITNSCFPVSQRYGLSSQLQRAAISVSSNIAEGTSRNSFKEQCRFTNIAYGSLMEVLSQLKIVYDLEYIDEIKYTELRNLIDIISISLCKLRNYQQHQFKLLNS